MENLQTVINHYLDYCQYQKRLDVKTLKAYRIDLKQFMSHINSKALNDITSDTIESFISELHKKYKPRTAKRKIASVKALFHYLDYKEYISINPFTKIQVKFREPMILPRTIPLHIIEILLKSVYSERTEAKTTYQKKNALRDAAVMEILFATGIRISELCSLKKQNVNLTENNILIYGKGSKERRLQIGNQDVVNILSEYYREYQKEIAQCCYFFVNQSGRPLSDQAVRRMLVKYSSLAKIDLHITPHMFRHTFATALLEADVDIRYIQEMLGHSSINVTEIYTHVTLSKQMDILSKKHPRNTLHI